MGKATGFMEYDRQDKKADDHGNGEWMPVT